MSERLTTQVPPATIQRLPIYLRCLLQAETDRMPVISSGEIAAMSGTNAAQVRKDLSFLGELGTRGVGYDVQEMIGHFSRVLGVTEHRRVALVGFGKLGGALLGYTGFKERGFQIVAVFDSDPAKVGTESRGLTVLPIDDLEEVLKAEDVEILIITTPAAAVQAVADRAVAAGIKAILNMAPTGINAPDDVTVRQVCISTDLQVLSFHLARQGDSTE
jgi:redox-sensing transcriptional repressor